MTEQEQIDFTDDIVKSAIGLLEPYLNCVTIVGLGLLPTGEYVSTMRGSGSDTARFVLMCDFIAKSSIVEGSTLPKEAQEVINAAKKFIDAMIRANP